MLLVLLGKVFARLQEGTTVAGLSVDGGESVSVLGQRVRGSCCRALFEIKATKKEAIQIKSFKEK